MEIKELQNKCLEITLVFKEFCEKHGLLFYLCGGGCIGAIRHHGFIPWDDDLDVFMPRADYAVSYTHLDVYKRQAVTVPFSSTEAADLLLDDQLIRWSVALNGSVTNCIV